MDKNVDNEAQVQRLETELFLKCIRLDTILMMQIIFLFTYIDKYLFCWYGYNF